MTSNRMGSEPTDVCIRGAGAVGASLALALSRQGLRVVLQAGPAPTGQPDVRTYALNAASMALLQSLKVWEALPPDAVTPVHDMQVQGDAQPGAIRFSAWDQAVPALCWIVDAAALEEALHAALRFAPHVRRAGPDEAVDAPLTALCEGKHSATRERLGIHFDMHWYGHRAIAARLVADRPHDGTARQWFRSPDVLALLPFDRPQPGCSYGLVWSLPEARAAQLLALPPAEFEQTLNDATGGAAGRLQLGSERAAWPLGVGQAHRFSGPGWVLLGDSAHVVHPLAGQGLNLGLADVQALAETLAARESWRPLGDERLLARYARRRLGPTAAMATVTDGLLHLFAPPAPWLRELRNRGLSLVDHLPGAKRWLAGRALGL